MKVYVIHTLGRRHGLSELECEINVLKSIQCGRELIKKGHNPFLPNLWWYVHKAWEDSPQEGGWFKMVSDWMQFCDAVFVGAVPEWEDSGVHREIKMATEMGKVIYYRLEDIPDA
jgi:hypothetical protein